MRTETRNKIQCLTIYNPYEPFSRNVNNVFVIIYGDSGHGKSMTLENYAEKMHHDKYLIIFLTEKTANRLEAGFASMLPMSKFHTDKLKEQEKPQRKQEIMIYAAWAFNPDKFWTKKLPPVKPWTANILEITEDLWSILFEVPTKQYAIRVVKAGLKLLKPGEGVRDLINICERLIKTKKVEGTQNTIDDIRTVLKPIADLGVIMPSNCKYNLDPDEIIFNQKPYHIFYYGFLPEDYEKVEYFLVCYAQHLIISRYKKLKKDVRKSRNLSPILWVIQESNVFMPEKTDKFYHSKTAELLMAKNKQIRSLNMSSVADAQNIYKTSSDYDSSMTENFYGKLITSDVERLSKPNRYNVRIRQRLLNMPKNHYLRKGFGSQEYVFLFPGHRHCEEGENFFVEYAKTYPEKLRKHSEAYSYLKELYDREKKRDILYKMEKQRKIKEKKLKKEMKGIEKLEKSEQEKDRLRDELQKKEKSLTEKTYIEIYHKSKLNPALEKPPAWTVLGAEYGISDKTAAKYAQLGKKLVEQGYL